MRGSLQVAAVAVALVACGQVLADQPSNSSIGKKIDGFSLPDIHGNDRTLAELRGDKALVVAFVGVECPLVNCTVRAAGAGQRVRIEGGEVRRHRFESARLAGRDRVILENARPEVSGPQGQQQRVADRSAQSVLPKRFCSTATGRSVWGRIDDQYGFKTGAGYVKPELSSATWPRRSRVLAGQPVSKSRGQGRWLLDRPCEARAAWRRHLLEADRADPAESMRGMPSRRRSGSLHARLAMAKSWVGPKRFVKSSGRPHAAMVRRGSRFGHFENDARLSDEEKQQSPRGWKTAVRKDDSQDLPSRASLPGMAASASRTRCST